MLLGTLDGICIPCYIFYFEMYIIYSFVGSTCSHVNLHWKNLTCEHAAQQTESTAHDLIYGESVLGYLFDHVLRDLILLLPGFDVVFFLSSIAIGPACKSLVGEI